MKYNWPVHPELVAAEVNVKCVTLVLGDKPVESYYYDTWNNKGYYGVPKKGIDRSGFVYKALRV